MLDLLVNEKDSRRGAMAKITELGAGVLLGLKGVSNWSKQDTYHTLSLEKASFTQGKSELSNELKLQENILEALRNLKDAYKDKYEKTEITSVPSQIGETTILVPQEYTYWDIPEGLPSFSEISSLERSVLGIKLLNDQLKNSELVDINKLANITIRAKKGDDLSRKILTALVYSGSVGLLLGYEELQAYEKSIRNKTSFLTERYGNTESHLESRRGFIKIGAATLGIGASLLVGNNIDKRLAKSESRLKEELETTSNASKKSFGEVVEEFYGITLDEHLSKTQKIINTSKSALVENIDSFQVRQAFIKLHNKAKDYLVSLKQTMNLPDSENGLAYLIKSYQATKKLNSASTSDERVATLGAILEGLGISVAISAVIIPNAFFEEKVKKEKV